MNHYQRQPAPASPPPTQPPSSLQPSAYFNPQGLVPVANSVAVLTASTTKRYLSRNLALMGICLMVFISSFSLSSLFENYNQYQEAFNFYSDDTLQAVDFNNVDPQVVALADDLQLTDLARRIFYASSPKIFTSSLDEDYICDDVLIRYNTQGCWHLGKIYILEDKNILKTATHELIHAIHFYEINQQIDSKVYILLNQAEAENQDFVHQKLLPYTASFVNLNDDERRIMRYSEIYAFVGSELPDLPQALEDHYAQYFKNRQKIVGSDGRQSLIDPYPTINLPF